VTRHLCRTRIIARRLFIALLATACRMYRLFFKQASKRVATTPPPRAASPSRLACNIALAPAALPLPTRALSA